MGFKRGIFRQPVGWVEAISRNPSANFHDHGDDGFRGTLYPSYGLKRISKQKTPNTASPLLIPNQRINKYCCDFRTPLPAPSVFLLNFRRLWIGLNLVNQ